MKCCQIKTVFGRNLVEGAKFVSVCTIILGSIFLIMSFTIMVLQHKYQWDSRNAVSAIYYVSSLLVTSISFYQILISCVFLWILLKTKGNMFVGSVWYVSHLTIISIYVMMCTTLCVVSGSNSYHLLCGFTIVGSIAYIGILIYFTIAINSYMNSLDIDRYF